MGVDYLLLPRSMVLSPRTGVVFATSTVYKSFEKAEKPNAAVSEWHLLVVTIVSACLVSRPLNHSQQLKHPSFPL